MVGSDGLGGKESEGSVADTLSLPSTDDEPGHTEEVDEVDFMDPTTDRTPRIRRTESYPDRVAMETSRVGMVNKISPTRELIVSSWREFSSTLEKYCSDYYLLFRARDTRTVKNTTRGLSDLQIPTKMKYSYKKSRSKGQRNTPSRYTGCKARFTVTARNLADEEGRDEWKIVLRNWSWTHNHRTNATNCTSYFGAGSIPEKSLVFDQVGVLADTNTESNQIQQFLSGALDCHVTPQQARNIFRKVLKSTPADKQLSRMLDTLATFADHRVLVIRDQNDVTSGVVIQTVIQRLVFERWGESLCMD
ncbi:hypothetical protein PPTG_08598 [Phytophthora nicotianae INRA-310]|uniref:Uncharacterized protein n=1 Tax=Phytophthora nicotianae (strain INRA-310) TaxID=761204 RepID=W2QN58_PHYN3|nr:hypothetical protein PPTG_08598 [Phytophthora nicotianae INRA-310]ETN13919.1 hypothetical protein PPTG_08598 [Phytophthora nicotianae INRA-310]